MILIYDIIFLGHVCLTDDDKDNAKNNRGSLLYGELLPRGANKVRYFRYFIHHLFNESKYYWYQQYIFIELN